MKLRRTLAAAAVTTAALIAAPAPADAGSSTYMTHSSPDAGYNTAWNVVCMDGRYALLTEGASSSFLCGGGIKGFYVKAGMRISCAGGTQNYATTGYHAANWVGNLNCVAQAR